MDGNLRHWDALAKTDPKHTKPFQRAGGFKGTAIKPIWAAKQMTEHFGPCGVGWGMERPEFTTITVGDEILVYCTVSLWYRDEAAVVAGNEHGGWSMPTVYGVGGDKVAVKRQSGVIADDEAFKKAYTDALSNAMKQIGVGADVHMGLFDDAKYVNELRQEFAENDKPAPAAQAAPPKLATDRPKRDEQFFKGKSYEISPKALGSYSAWEAAYRIALATAKNLDELCKLEEDNREHHKVFCAKAHPDVVEALREFTVKEANRLKTGLAA